MHLRVIVPFADYRVGDEITDSGVVAEILDGPNHRFVVKVAPPPAAE